MFILSGSLVPPVSQSDFRAAIISATEAAKAIAFESIRLSGFQHIKYRSLDGILIVDITTESLNKSDAVELSYELKFLASELHCENHDKVVLNFSHVRDANNAFIEGLLSLQNQVGKGNLFLCEVKPGVLDVLRITHLDRILNICTTESEALEALKK